MLGKGLYVKETGRSETWPISKEEKEQGLKVKLLGEKVKDSEA